MSTALIDGQKNFASGPAGAKLPIGMGRAVLNLTSAQILALQTTGIQLVAAPGAGKMIVPILAIQNFVGGSIAYTNAGGAVQVQVGSRVKSLTEAAITTVSPNSTHTTDDCTGASTAANPPTDENAAMVLKKITNNYAAGNGTMSVVVYYTIEDTAPVAD